MANVMGGHLHVFQSVWQAVWALQACPWEHVQVVTHTEGGAHVRLISRGILGCVGIWAQMKPQAERAMVKEEGNHSLSQYQALVYCCVSEVFGMAGRLCVVVVMWWSWVCSV